MCGSNSFFFLVLCGLLFLLLGFLVWLEARDPASRGRHADLRDECMTATPRPLGSLQTYPCRSAAGFQFWVPESPNSSIPVCSRCHLSVSELGLNGSDGPPACRDCSADGSRSATTKEPTND